MEKKIKFFIKNTFIKFISNFLFNINKLIELLPFRLLKKKSKRAKKLIIKYQIKFYCEHLPYFYKEPVFVIIGANDGLNDHYSDIILNNKKCKGLLIEPFPYNIKRLKANYQDSRRFLLEQVAIDSTPGEATFYSVDPSAYKIINCRKHSLDRIGSLDRKHLLKFFNGALEQFIIETKVKVCTLSCILKKNRIRDIHFLQIDTEGNDFEVLKTLDFAIFSPLMIIVEHIHLSNKRKTEMVKLLQKNHYSIIKYGIDFIALNKKFKINFNYKMDEIS